MVWYIQWPFKLRYLEKINLIEYLLINFYNSKVSCVRVRHLKYVNINHFNTISANFIHTHIKKHKVFKTHISFFILFDNCGENSSHCCKYIPGVYGIFYLCKLFLQLRKVYMVHNFLSFWVFLWRL